MISVQGNGFSKRVRNFWNHIHFHPTDAIEDEWGRRILDDVAADRVAGTVRMYAMFEDIVSKDENGQFRYDFTLNDLRMDYMVSKGFDLFVIYAYIPPFMAVDPSLTSAVSKNKTRYKGKMIVTSPPRDISEWEEICYVYTKHIVERYGIERVSRWQLQCRNEPDIRAFFMGDLPNTEENALLRLEEYLKTYRAFASGVHRVSDRLSVGGPSVAKYMNFLDGFLKAVKEEGLPLDFVSIHTYGTTPTALNEGTKPFSADATLVKHKRHEEIVDRYFPGLEIVTDEWGAATGGFCNREECPALMLREGSEFAAYMGKMLTAYIENDARVSKMMICLSGQHEMTVDFSGFRNFFTLHHIRKPIYNAFCLLRRIHENILPASCDNPLVSVLATRSDGGAYSVALSYASEHFDGTPPMLHERIRLDGITGKHRVRIWRIDDTHTNPYRMALRKGWGDGAYTDEQLALLREEGMLKPFLEYERDFDADGTIDVELEGYALVLIELE